MALRNCLAGLAVVAVFGLASVLWFEQDESPQGTATAVQEGLQQSWFDQVRAQQAEPPLTTAEQEALLVEDVLGTVRENMGLTAARPRTAREIAEQGVRQVMACASPDQLHALVEESIQKQADAAAEPARPPLSTWMGLAVAPEREELPILPCALSGVELNAREAIERAVLADLPSQRPSAPLPFLDVPEVMYDEVRLVRTPYTCGIHVLYWPPSSFLGGLEIAPFVSLLEALESGLRERDYGRFITDVENVTIVPKVVGQAKGDKDAAGWMPWLDNRAWYARKVVEVKQKYGLSVDPAEQRVLARTYKADAEVDCPGPS